MTDKEFTIELARRLNAIIESDPDVRKDVSELLKQRVLASEATVLHPTLQVSSGVNATLSTIGLLSGIAGKLPDGKFKDWSRLSARVDSNSELVVEFVLTEDFA